jgi:cyclin-dependent kinase regulatory subunit CKS1
MLVDAPPPITLPEYIRSGEFEDFFEPVRIAPPSSDPVPTPALDPIVKENIWYISVASDSVFEYRSVEIPFEILDALPNGGPNRNYTEAEWRSIGITQSHGWENHCRSFAERNVFMFRRPRPNVDPRDVVRCIIGQLEKDVKSLEKALKTGMSAPVESMICNQLRDCFNFPMIYFDGERNWDGLVKAPITSAKRLIEYQVSVFRATVAHLRRGNSDSS